MDAAGVTGVVVKPCYEKEFIAISGILGEIAEIRSELRGIMRNNLGSLSHGGRYPVGGHGSDSPPDPPNPRCRARPDSLQCTQDGQFTVSSVFAGFWSPGPTFMKPVQCLSTMSTAGRVWPDPSKLKTAGGHPSSNQCAPSKKQSLCCWPIY